MASAAGKSQDFVGIREIPGAGCVRMDPAMGLSPRLVSPGWSARLGRVDRREVLELRREPRVDTRDVRLGHGVAGPGIDAGGEAHREDVTRSDERTPIQRRRVAEPLGREIARMGVPGVRDVSTRAASK